MSRAVQIIALIVIASCCVGCDQATKVYFKQRFDGRKFEVESYLGDTIRLQYAENTGAFLSMFNTLPAWTFVTFGCVLIIGMLIYLFRMPQREWTSTILFALLVGGAIGNLIDRISLGCVRDFANVGLGPIRTGIFNVADVAITGGVIVLLITGLRHKEPKLLEKSPENSDENGGSA